MYDVNVNGLLTCSSFVDYNAFTAVSRLGEFKTLLIGNGSDTKDSSVNTLRFINMDVKMFYCIIYSVLRFLKC